MPRTSLRKSQKANVPKRPRGRPKKTGEEIKPADASLPAPKVSVEATHPDTKKKKGRQKGTSNKPKEQLITMKMQNYILDMFEIYEKQHGKDSMLTELKKDPKFASIFIKEFFSFSKKYMDMEIARMKINAEVERAYVPPADGQNRGPTFIVMGLHSVPPDVQAQLDAQKDLQDEKTVEAKFVTVGLNP